MKYKVSLLPEKNRKRILGKKKAEKGRGIVNIVMLVLLAALFICVICNAYAGSKLSEIEAKNAQYEQQVAALQQYRDINNTLQSKIKLKGDIQVNEPSLYNFVARLGNVDNPGVSITNLSCIDWKTSRLCTLTGTAISRDAFTAYLEAVSAIQGVSNATCTSYTVAVSEGEAEATFSISISCDGGAAPIVVETTAAETEDTTVAE